MFNPILKNESEHSIFGAPGRYFGATMRHDEAPGCFCKQRWISERRPFTKYHKLGYLQVTVRFDDDCRNGHNSFAITADASHPGARDFDACGCLHDDIADAFPELAPLIKWHLSATDGPMHYLANTIYHASDRDCHGLKNGESRQLKNGKTGLPSWELVAVDADGDTIPTYKLPRYQDSAEAPTSEYRLEWRPWCRIGEGKARDLDAARACAVWPEATDAELLAPGLKERLDARLPGLLAEFRQTVESIGFMWERA